MGFLRIGDSLCCRTYSAALDEPGGDEGLAGVFLSATDVGDPAHDSTDDGAAVPMDVCDGWFAPLEGGVGVGAHKGYIFWHLNASSGEELLSCDEQRSFIKDQSGGWGNSKQ